MNEVDLGRAREALQVLQSLICTERPEDYRGDRRGGIAFCAEITLAAIATRKKILGPDLSGEASWEILIALYVAWFRNERMSTTDVGYAAGMPITTALRWMSVLASKGMICREDDVHDARRIWIKLSKTGRTLVETCIEAQQSLRHLPPSKAA